MSWPNTADGDVFRRLENSNFDFDQEYDIDFNIDFNNWPLSEDGISFFKTKFPEMRIIDPDNDEIPVEEPKGYILIQIRHKLEYDFVILMQNKLTELSKPFGGWCDSWGVLHG